MASLSDRSINPTALLDGKPLWQGRNAIAPVVLVALPTLVFTAIFIAILWIIGPNSQSGYWRVGGMRIPMSPAEIKATGWFFVTVVPLMLTFGAAYPIWRICRLRMTITRQAIVSKEGRFSVIWPVTELQKLTFRDNFGWYVARFSVSSGKPPRILISGNDAILLANVAAELGLESELPERLAIASDLALGEIVKWSGRRGFRAFQPEHGVALSLIVTPTLLYTWWMWAIWKDFQWVSVIHLIAPLMWSLLALIVIGFSAFGIVFQFRTMVMDWFRDALGTIAVTDRRIVFSSPFSARIYFEVAAEDLVFADLIETDGGYGWISVRRRVDDLDYEVYGVPEPAKSLEAIRALIQPA